MNEDQDHEETGAPIRRCSCGNVIGDGDWVQQGYRKCPLCRRPRPRPRLALPPRIRPLTPPDR